MLENQIQQAQYEGGIGILLTGLTPSHFSAYPMP